MNPREALDAALDLGAKKSIGMHWVHLYLQQSQLKNLKLFLMN